MTFLNKHGLKIALGVIATATAILYFTIFPVFRCTETLCILGIAWVR